MTSDPVVILSYARTPMGAFQGALSGATATELGATAVRGAVERAGVDPGSVDKIFMGCVLPAGLGQAPARQAAIGAGLPERLDAVLRTAMTMNLILTGVIVGLVYLFSRNVVALFISSPQVVDLAQHLLHIITWSALMFGAGSIFSGIMRSSGTVLPPMTIAIGSILLVELPVAFALSRMHGLGGVWWGYVAGFAALMLMQGLYYGLVWRRREIVALV